MLEVALRNVADGKLKAVYGNDWMDDAAVLTTRYQQDCVRKAREQLTRDRGGPHGLIVGGPETCANTASL